MKNLLFALIFAISCNASTPRQEKPVFTIENKINLKKCGIDLSGMNEGITGFSILPNNRVAIGYDSLILVVDSIGNVVKKIGFDAIIGHFDINTEGTGIVALNDKLCKISKFQRSGGCFRPALSMKGNTQGMLRIDLVNNDSIRIISLSPDFVVKTKIDNIQVLKPEKQNFLDSCLIEKITEFVGFYKGKALFFTPDYNAETKQTFYDFVAFSVEDGQFGNEFSRVRIFDIDFGDFMLLSYPCRYNGGDYGYVMVKREDEVDIVKIDLTKLVN